MTQLQKSIFFTIVICVFIGFIIDSDKENNKTVLPEDLTLISGTIQNKLMIDYGSKGKKSLTIQLNEFPDVAFVFDGIYLEALNSKQLIADAKIGDTVFLKILHSDFQQKISKKQPIRISRRIINFKSIVPYGIQIRSKHYIDLKEINDNWISETKLLFWTFIMIIVGCLTYLLLDITGLLNRFKNWFNEIQNRH